MRTPAWFAVSLMVVGCSGSSGDTDNTTPPGDETGTTADASDDTGTTGDDSAIVDSGSTEDEGPGVPDGDVTGSDGPGDTTTPTAGATIPNLKVAFVGDQGASSNTTAVLKLIKAEGAHFLVVLGDFDYKEDADLWDAQLTTGLGADFPVFAAVGNHDEPVWPDYKKKLEARLAKITGAKCTGDYGVKSSCTYQGLFFILSGVGTMGTGHDTYIKDQLAADKSIWRVCAWHKNQHDMQIGDKGNEVGWPAYQACQNGGAMVMTGHEHSYSRTKTLMGIGNAAMGHGATGEFAKMIVKTGAPGSNFVTVSGLGGVGIRDYQAAQHADDTWWASWYAVNGHLKNGVKLSTPSGYAATFVTYNVDGDPKKARGYAKNVAGVELDSYEIRRE